MKKIRYFTKATFAGKYMIWILIRMKVIYLVNLLILGKHNQYLLSEFTSFKKTQSKGIEKKKTVKIHTVEVLSALYIDREMVINAFKSGTFPLQPTESRGNLDMSAPIAEVSDALSLKILSPKQMI